MTIAIGDLIIDNYGREGIVLARDKQPGPDWLAIQEDTRMPALASGTWWLVMPVDSGGGVSVPESLATFVRRATLEDAARVVAVRASSHVSLVKLFPDLKAPAAGIL